MGVKNLITEVVLIVGRQRKDVHTAIHAEVKYSVQGFKGELPSDRLTCNLPSRLSVRSRGDASS